MSSFSARFATPAVGCAGLTAAAVLIHGYHLGTDDAGIWVPAIKQAADPSLYPFGGEFFQAHAHMSLFPALLGWCARLTHLPADLVIFGCYVVGIFLLLGASWQLLAACFKSERARWGGVALLAALLSVPVAGTAIPIMDPYVTSRTLSTPFALLAIAAYLSGRPRRAAIWLVACGLMHPQMAAYAAVLLGMMEWRRLRSAASAAAPVFGLLAIGWLPFLWNFQPARGAAREALHSRTYFFVTQWAWYEWLGVAVPLILLWWLARMPLRSGRPALPKLLPALVPFGLLFTAGGLLLAASPRLENYTRLQPMRAFQLVYIAMFLVLGALAGEYVLQKRYWLWAALFLPLAAGMAFAAQGTFPNSPHVEWPGAAPQGAWCTMFRWVRDHTPKDAVFALDPDYLRSPGEDMQGFRALAERSALADRVKDSGAVSLFPQLASDWAGEVHAETGWAHFSTANFEALAQQYPVTWIVTRTPPAGMSCPYRTASLDVCRIPPADQTTRALQGVTTSGPTLPR
jgi:hypothetical protein